MLLIAAFVVIVAVLVWLGRGKPVLTRGQWRVGAGLVGILGLIAAALSAVRGAVPVGGVLAVLSLGLLAAARTQRGPYRSGGATQSGLSLQEARALLGVGEAAGEAEIRAAHARLIAKVHPDRGGTSGLAAQLNAARDRLLKR